MKRAWPIWTAYAASVALAAAAMAYVSAELLRLDAAGRRANRQADAETKIGLALWRMDSAVIPLIAAESARPPEAYAAVPRLETFSTGLVMPAPSPLLTAESPQVLLHFQLDAAGGLISPQAPTGYARNLVAGKWVPHARLAEADKRLAELAPVLGPAERRRLLAALAAPPAATAPPLGPLVVRRGDLAAPMRDQANTNLAERRTRGGAALHNRADVARDLNTSEQAMRFSAAQQAQTAGPQWPPIIPGQDRGGVGPLRPVWVGRALLLARRARVDGAERVQGCWLDWDAIRRSLRDVVADLLPAAELLPCPAAEPTAPAGTSAPSSAAAAGQQPPYMLASLPVRLVPGPVSMQATADPWPIAWTLALPWAGLLVAAAAAAAALAAVLSLSRRRELFATAVTHELRTPLTTFRLYAEMLADGVVADEPRRGEYHRRLRDEAERLAHLVANVLAYARLSRRRAAGGADSVALGELVERSREGLAAAAQRAGMELVVEPPADDQAAAAVRCNADAVAQVLANLVDNACKYAARADDRRIHLAAAAADGKAVLRVRDHGPGIAPGQRRRIFRAFRKSAEQAAGTAPGVGLGLSLSRRLARSMRGELRCEAPAGGGACFALSLPTEK